MQEKIKAYFKLVPLGVVERHLGEMGYMEAIPTSLRWLRVEARRSFEIQF